MQHHFRRDKFAWTEDFFLAVLKHSHRKYDVYWAVLGLRDCGTSRSIPHLKDKLAFPMQDIKATAILTIAHIAGPAETALYAEALLDPKYREKGYAMWAIRDSADDRAVDAVIAYFRKNMSRIRRGQFHNATLPDGLEYLHKFIDAKPEVTMLFSDIKGCWEQIAEGERVEISKRAPYFLTTGSVGGAG